MKLPFPCPQGKYFSIPRVDFSVLSLTVGSSSRLLWMGTVGENPLRGPAESSLPGQNSVSWRQPAVQGPQVGPGISVVRVGFLILLFLLTFCTSEFCFSVWEMSSGSLCIWPVFQTVPHPSQTPPSLASLPLLLFILSSYTEPVLKNHMV